MFFSTYKSFIDLSYVPSFAPTFGGRVEYLELIVRSHQTFLQQEKNDNNLFDYMSIYTYMTPANLSGKFSQV
jgi:hypothetical protein